MYNKYSTNYFQWLYPNDFFNTLGSTWYTYTSNIEDTQDSYSISYEIPGVEAKDILVTPEKGRVYISYTKKYKDCEQSSGFSYSLPESVDINTCDPVSKNGVLTINFKKVKSAQPCPVKVREG